MKKIKTYIKRIREKIRLEKEAELKAGFGIAARYGCLWLTHHGVAFQQIPDGTTAREVAKILREACISAVLFTGNKK